MLRVAMGQFDASVGDIEGNTPSHQGGLSVKIFWIGLGSI